jgi:hypothetical protein
VRYEVGAIRDPECDGLGSISPNIQFQSNSLDEVKREMPNFPSTPYGYAIYDRQENLIDWGLGFGVELPDPESAG